MKNASNKVVQKLETHILCSVTFFFFENHAIYEIMWKNTVEQGRPQMTTWRMRIACRIPKSTNTHSQHAILIVFPLQQWLHALVSMVRYTYIAFPVNLLQNCTVPLYYNY